MFFLIRFALASLLLVQIQTISIENSEYRNIVIEIKDSVPESVCGDVLSNLEKTMITSSEFLFTALDGRAFLKSVTIIVPFKWSSSCIPNNSTIQTSNGEKSDITVVEQHPTYLDNIFTQQSGGCGEQGDQIYMSYESLRRPSIGKEFVREWAKYRYGVFDEIGFKNDNIYPQCYTTDRQHVTGCSDLPANDLSICEHPENESSYDKVDENARTSILFAAEAPNVSMFCDEGTHNRFAPTKHNQICNRHSTLNVILKHKDFSMGRLNKSAPGEIRNTTTQFTYKKREITRYVVVIDETQDISIRESWNFLRNAIRLWLVYDLPENTEVGIILSSGTKKLQSLAKDVAIRDSIASFIPYSSTDLGQTCISCAIQDAMEMLNNESRKFGPANSVVLVIAPGMDFNIDSKKITKIAVDSNIRLTTINYPGIIRRQPLDELSSSTGGSSYTVFETKENSEKTLLTTYFELRNILYNIVVENYQGNAAVLPIEIHRKKLVDDLNSNGSKRHNRIVTGSFYLDKTMGVPASFYVYTHDQNQPLIASMKLVSPSGNIYSTRSDLRLSMKQLIVPANINETGSWSYTIERFNVHPQPHFVQVMATPRNPNLPYIRTKAWIKKISETGPFILYAEVKNGEKPVLSALVEVTVTRPDIECNASIQCEETFKLLDTGSSDPDITKGDGIYTRYFNTKSSEAGTYKFDIKISDNGNTAYSMSSYDSSSNTKCCGSDISNMPNQGKEPITSFERVLPAITVFVKKDQEHPINNIVVETLGRIGDLRSEIVDSNKARLSWTSPDMGGLNVARYELKYSQNVKDIIDNFETAAIQWNHDIPFAFSIGDDTSFILNLTAEENLIGKPLFFAIRSYSKLAKDAIAGPVSNYVRVFIPKPKRKFILPTSSVSNAANNDIWPYSNNDGDDEGGSPKVAKTIDFGLELIIPIVAGISLILIFLCVYCYFCVIRRKSRNSSDHKKTIKNITTNILSPNHHKNFTTQQQQQPQPNDYILQPENPDPHTIGLPIYEDENFSTNKRCSMDNYHEQQLIEELKQQQSYNHCQLSIISTNTNTLVTKGRNLSPYESWTASQLLHEHERRHSPVDEMMNQNTFNNPDMQHLNHPHADQISLLKTSIAVGNGPPVPPLPYQQLGYQHNYHIYGVSQNQPPPNYTAINNRNPAILTFNPSLQGSMSSVNSGDKKRRNVTMV